MNWNISHRLQQAGDASRNQIATRYTQVVLLQAQEVCRKTSNSSVALLTLWHDRIHDPIPTNTACIRCVVDEIPAPSEEEHCRGGWRQEDACQLRNR